MGLFFLGVRELSFSDRNRILGFSGRRVRIDAYRIVRSLKYTLSTLVGLNLLPASGTYLLNVFGVVFGCFTVSYLYKPRYDVGDIGNVIL